MTDCQGFTIEIDLRSSLGTPFQSDTFFGHLCWSLRFLWGEEKLQEFLSRYENRESPPLLLSDGFPVGYLPKPVLPPVSPTDLDRIVGKENRIHNSFMIKAIKKAVLMRRDIFFELQQDAITPEKLFKAMKSAYKNEEGTEGPGIKESIQHNTIDRITGSVRDGGLFIHEDTFFEPESSRFEVYLKTNCFSMRELEKIFEYMGEGGFGRDKSTGKGHFTFQIREGINLPETENPNAFMTLSSYIPHAEAPTRGHYRTLHKYGKLGGTYAQGSPEAHKNPFKKPLLMFAAGSTFYDPDFKSGKIYGSLLREVHINKDIRHYAYAFPVGIRLEDKGC
ncbi:MAG: hypothetical protein HZA01_08700 [Nitrospinae bacterium]|nr:hypothetical protein [Nitrospinota bacterium]